MQKWKSFLETLPTPGGALLIMLVCLCGACMGAAVAAKVMPERENVYSMFANLVPTFGGGLLALVRIRSSAVDATGNKNVEVNVEQPKE